MDGPGQTDTQTLADELRAHVERARAGRSPVVNAVMDRMVDELRRSGIAAAAPAAGDRAPGFELPDQAGRPVRLAALLERGPVVLAFYRGGWCPYCNLQLRAYQRALPEMRALGAELVAVSPQIPDASLSTAERNELAYPVLSDVGNRVARAYGIVFALPSEVIEYYVEHRGHDLTAANGDDSWELPVPATFVIDRDGTVRLADVDPDYTRRLEPAAILAALQG
jgi:peroxiredoxin